MKDAVAVSLLYQRQEGRELIQKVLSVIVLPSEGDDGFDHKAKAERHVSNDKELAEATKDMHVAAWDVAIPGDDYQMLFGRRDEPEKLK